MAEATQEMIALAENIATEVADRSIYKKGTDNYARVWQGARSGALARLTAKSGEGRSGAGEDEWCSIDSAPRDGTWFIACATEPGWRAIRIVRYRYPDDHLPTHGEGSWPSPPTHWMPLKPYPAEAALNARQSGEGERGQ